MVTGSPTFPGAGVLGVGAALACGPGMVRYLGQSPLVMQRFPEVVCVAGQVQAWLVGSGLDPQQSDFSVVYQAIESGLPIVIDAGALGLTCDKQFSPTTVLTPHPGELTELLGRRGYSVNRGEVEAQLYRYTSLASQETGAVVVTTSAHDVVATPDGTIYQQTGATPWRATAGAGDVYAGILGALLAIWQADGQRKVDVGWLAACAAFLHARAANLAARADHGVGYPIKASNISDALGQTIWQVLNP